MLVESANVDTVAPYRDPSLWLKLAEVLGPAFAYLALVLVFLLCIFVVRQLPSIAPYLAWLLPWTQKGVPEEKQRQLVRQPELIDADDAAEVIEATRRHGEMRILTKIADGENVAVVYMDTDGVVHVFNRAAESLTGYSEAEMLGTNISVLMDSTHARFHDMYVKSYLAEREKGTRSRLVGRVRYVTLRRKDGTMIPIKIRLTEISNGIKGFWATMESNDPSNREPDNGR